MKLCFYRWDWRKGVELAGWIRKEAEHGGKD